MNFLKVLGKSEPKSEKRLDYFTYGMLLGGRHGSEADDYMYGFQGQEMDDEIRGEGNSVNYKYRMHDPRIGRFFAVDPLTAKYPHYSPYSFSGNEVIAKVEFEGLEPANPGEFIGQSKLAQNPFSGNYHNYTWTSTGSTSAAWTTDYIDVPYEDVLDNSLGIDNSDYPTWTAEMVGITRVYTQNAPRSYGFGSSDRRGSDGMYWIGCLACHSTNGAYRLQMSVDGWDDFGMATFTSVLTIGTLGTLSPIGAGGGFSGLGLGSTFGGNALRTYLGVKWAGAIQSGGLNLFTQLYGHNWDIGEVDATGVLSAGLAGYWTGPGFSGLMKASFLGAAGDASFDWSYNSGPSMVYINKSPQAFLTDFTFGFMGNLGGGAGGQFSGNMFNSFTTPGFLWETIIDAGAINGNIHYLNNYVESLPETK